MGLFLVLYPIMRYFDWSNMKLPEFKLFELSVTRNATLVSLGMLLLCPLYPLLGTPRVLASLPRGSAGHVRVSKGALCAPRPGNFAPGRGLTIGRRALAPWK